MVGLELGVVEFAFVLVVIVGDEFGLFFEGVCGEGANERDFFVEVLAGTSSGHDVAMAEDVWPVFAAEIGAAVGGEAVDFAFLVNEFAEAGEGDFGNGVVLVVAEESDAYRSVIAGSGVSGDDAFTSGATFVDLALLVDYIVVADVAPTASGCVILVNVANGLGRIIEVFGCSAMVDDDFFDAFGILKWPDVALAGVLVLVDDVGVLEFVFVFFVEFGVAFDEDLFFAVVEVAEVFVGAPVSARDDLGLDVSGGFDLRFGFGCDFAAFDECPFDVLD